MIERPPHPSAASPLPSFPTMEEGEVGPSPLVGEGRGPRPKAVGRVRGNADGLTRRQLLEADTVACSRSLRRQMGEPELRLWRALRETFPQSRFRRQVPIGPYYADFCAHGPKLIVEVDGDDHVEKIERDAARTRFLQNEGYTVIRFANADVMQNLDGVMAAIGGAIARTRKDRP